MQISARNVLKGSVTQIQHGAVNDEVILAIAGGDTIAAIVTSTSVRNLGLAVGKEVVAIVKASSVLVSTDTSGMRLSARNALRGTITNVVNGTVESAVTIGMPGGTAIHATITHAAAKELGLKAGMPATAIIKASSVILAVAQ